MMFHLFLNNLVTLAADLPWYLAGICGVAISSVWNYGVNTTVTWRRTLKSYGRVAEAVLEAGGPIERPEAVA